MRRKFHARRTVRLRTDAVTSVALYSRNSVVFAGPVALAGSFHPIPFRTRSLKSPAPMVLRLKAWESRSPPGLPSRQKPVFTHFNTPPFGAAFFCAFSSWASLTVNCRVPNHSRARAGVHRHRRAANKNCRGRSILATSHGALRF